MLQSKSFGKKWGAKRIPSNQMKNGKWSENCIIFPQPNNALLLKPFSPPLHSDSWWIMYCIIFSFRSSCREINFLKSEQNTIRNESEFSSLSFYEPNTIRRTKPLKTNATMYALSFFFGFCLGECDAINISVYIFT